MNPDQDDDQSADRGMEMLAVVGTAALLFLGTVMRHIVGWLA